MCPRSVYITKPFKPKEVQACIERWASAAKDLDNDIDDVEDFILDLNHLRSFALPIRLHLRTLFQDLGPKNLQLIKQRLNLKQYDLLAKEAHSLKGYGSGVGAKKLQKLCKKLQRYGLDEKIDSLSDIFGELEVTFDKTLNTLLISDVFKN